MCKFGLFARFIDCVAAPTLCWAGPPLMGLQTAGQSWRKRPTLTLQGDVQIWPFCTVYRLRRGPNTVLGGATTDGIADCRSKLAKTANFDPAGRCANLAFLHGLSTASRPQHCVGRGHH